MKAHLHWIWLMVLSLGWLLDFLFWKQAPGLNFSIYAFLCVGGGFFLLHLFGTHVAPRALWLVPLIAVFAVTTFVRAEPLTVGLGVVFSLFLMATLAVSCVDGSWLKFGIADFVVRFLRLAWSMLWRPIGFQLKAEGESKSWKSAGSRIWPIVRGILITIPILLLFGVLLGSADLIFQQQLNAALDLLRLERLPEHIFRSLIILAAAWALLGVFLHAAGQKHPGYLIADQIPAGARLLGIVEATVVLSGVIVLFAAFVLVQFRYFFGGAQNIGIEGFTYAEYARQGYGELIAVAFLSLLLLLALGAVTRRESGGHQRLFSALSVAVVLLVGIMLVSASMRLGLYEMAYGFTRLRTYAHASLIWLAVLLTSVVALQFTRRERSFATAVLACTLGFGLTLALMNVDAFIVRQDVGRAQRGLELDVPYLASISTDAVPGLVRAFRSESTLPHVRESVGAVLVCGWGTHHEAAPTDWRSFSLSRWHANKALATVATDLQEYRVMTANEMPRVRSPQGNVFDCIVAWG